MKELDSIQKRLLEEIADLHTIPEGAYNIRSNSASASAGVKSHFTLPP